MKLGYGRRIAIFVAASTLLLVALRPAEAYLNQWRAEQELMGRRHERSYSQLKRALTLYPRDVDTLISAGYIANRLGRTDEALAHYRAAAAADPRNAESLQYAALVLRAERDYPGAIAALRESLRREPSRMDRWQLLARMQAKYVSREDATSTWREIARRFPRKTEQANAEIERLEAQR